MDNQTYVLLSEIRDLMRESVELQKATLEEIRGANPQYPIHDGTLEDLFSQMY